MKGGRKAMSYKISNFIRKEIEVAPGIKIISMTSISESDSGIESGRDYVYLVTAFGARKRLLDSSRYSIDLQSATAEGDEIVIRWTKQEKRYEERRGVYDESYRIEEVIKPKECEERIPISRL